MRVQGNNSSQGGSLARRHGMRSWIIPLLVLTMPAVTFAQDAQAIIQQSVEAIDRDWKAAPEYDYYQRVRADHGTRTSKVMMILGSPYERLIAVNDRPLTAQQEVAEQQKLDRKIVQRQHESADDRAQRIAKYARERQQDQFLIEQLTQAMDFTLESQQKLNGRDVYVLRAKPRAGYQPPNMRAEVLIGMEGRLWVDKSTFQWVKVEATVVHPVTIEGFLAQVEPGTHFELEKSPVDNDIWLPKHFAMKSRSRIFFLVPHKSQDDETYWGYRKALEQDR